MQLITRQTERLWSLMQLVAWKSFPAVFQKIPGEYRGCIPYSEMRRLWQPVWLQPCEFREKVTFV
jgi:hypothetical protein